jgi:hypothetical protein
MAVILIALCTFTSCKKDKDAAATNESILVGHWEGFYGGLDGEPKQYYAFTILKNGSLTVKSDSKVSDIIGAGTWTLKDNEFKAVYQYPGQDTKFYAVAKFDEAQKKLTGTWGVETQNADLGKFYMIKQ